MPLINLKTAILTVATALFFSSHRTVIPADDLINLPELSWQLSDSKIVMAHCMTNIIRYKGHKFEDSCDPVYYAPDSNITASLGGLTQVRVLADSLLAEASLDEAVEFEMRAAIASGIDGFQFYYTLGNESWDDIIKAYFRVAKKRNIDFKFTFCISHPSGGDESHRISSFARRMNSIMKEVGRESKNWFRTPDGRLIIYTWYGDGLADIPNTTNRFPDQYYVADAFRRFGDAIGEKLACVISINEQISREKLNRYLDYFPAVWLWTLPYTDNYIGNMVARECKKRKRTFTGSGFADFYTSKLLKRGTWDMYHFADEAAAAGLAGSERKYIVTGLSYNFRKQLEFAVLQDVPIFNLITWNDYPEGHHLAPEANHNDGFSVLLKYYKSAWKKEASPYTGQDVIVAFYKKYRHDIQPSPYHFPVTEIEIPGIPVAVEDSVEIVTIVDQKAVLRFNGIDKQIDAGLHSTRFPSRPGPVMITLKRNDRQVAALNCSEWITDRPYRTDRLTYCVSNLCTSFYNALFGNATANGSAEYNMESPANRSSYYSKPVTP